MTLKMFQHTNMCFTWQKGLVLCLMYGVTFVHGIESSVYSLPANMFCNRDDWKPAESGILLTSPDTMRKNLNTCYMSFYLPGQEVLVNFVKLDITDCAVKLKMYSGYNTNITPMHDLTCNSASPGKFLTTSTNFTFTVDKPDGLEGFKWRIIMTAIKSKGSEPCDGFKCNNGYCIDQDLTSDAFTEINHCGDGSDTNGSGNTIKTWTTIVFTAMTVVWLLTN